MIYSAIAVVLMTCGLVTRDPGFFIAAGLYELVGVLRGAFTPRRLKKNDT